MPRISPTRFVRILIAPSFLMLASVAAQAAPMLLSFQVTGFGVAAGPVVPVPQDPVAGSILYDAASPTADIDSLLDINLTIAGHVYTVAELTFDSTTNTQGIGGAASGVNGLGATHDFFITWDQATLTPGSFFYTTPDGITVFSGRISAFSVVAAAVPEPASAIWLFLAGSMLLLFRHQAR